MVVSIATEQTNVMLLQGMLSRTRHPSVRLRGDIVTYAEKVMYLGVAATERMKFSDYLAFLSEKIARILVGLRRVLRKDWAALFGSVVWNSLCRWEYGRAEMNRCLRQVLHACVPVCRTMSTEAILVLMGVLPWDLKVLCRSALFRLLKCLGIRDWNLITGEEVHVIGIKARKQLVYGPA